MSSNEVKRIVLSLVKVKGKNEEVNYRPLAVISIMAKIDLLFCMCLFLRNTGITAKQ